MTNIAKSRQMTPLGTALRAARRGAGFTQVQLAALLGVRQGTISAWERGTTVPDGVSLACFAGLAGDGGLAILSEARQQHPAFVR